MSSLPLANGRRARPVASSPGGPVPGALDFARVLAACERQEQETLGFLRELRCRTVEVLSELGYEEIDVYLTEGTCSFADAAVAATLSAVMKLPGTGLNRADFSLSLPLVLTPGGELRVSGAEINGLMVKETFVHSLAADPGQLARVMIHGLSRLYMDHLLKLARRGESSQTCFLPQAFRLEEVR